jgi:hypothetical protein
LSHGVIVESISKYSKVEKQGVHLGDQVKMLHQKRWGLPFYWAAFQLHGESR